MAPLKRPKENPWQLKTPPGSSEYTMHTAEKDGVAILVCTVGSTVLHYDARCVEDRHAILKAAGDWGELGGANEQPPPKKAPSKPGAVRPATPSAAGMVSKKASAAASASIFRRCSKPSGCANWSTTRRTTSCARNK